MRADDLLDKNGNKIKLEDMVIYNDIECKVIGLSLLNENHNILIKSELAIAGLWVNKEDVEIISIP